MAYKNKSKILILILGERITMRQNRGRVQINPKSCGKRQTIWRREKKKRNQKPKQRRNKAAEEKKERNFNVNVTSNVSVKVSVILFNERG